MATSNLRFRIIGDDDASGAFLKTAAAARLTKSTFDDLNSSALGLTKLIGGTSLVPVAAGATAAITNLGTALSAAGLAAGVFGLSAGGIFADMLKSQQAIKSTEASLSKLTKGSDEYKQKLKELHAQQFAFNSTFGPAAKGYTDMGNAFSKFKDATSDVTKGVLHDAFEGIAQVLPKLVPVSNLAGEAIGGLINEMVDGIDGPGFKHFLHFLETSGPRDITAFGHIIGNTIGGLGGIFSNFVRPGDHAAETLEHLTKRFDAWGHSKGVSDSVDRFLRYVSDNGPQINSTMSALAESAPKIATAMGRLGSANLSVTSRFLNLVAGLPQGAFNAIATGLFAIAAGSKLVAGAKGIAALVSLGQTGLGKGGGSGVGGSLGVQKVWVVNMGEGGLGGGPPGSPGGKGGGGMGWLSKLLIGPAALAAVSIGGHDVVKKLYGQTAATIFSQVNQAVLHIPYMPPDAIKRQADVWNAAFTGHFDKAIAILKAPGPADFNMPSLHAPNLGGLFGMPKDAAKPIKALGTAFEAMQARAAKASRQIDLIGPHAQQAGSRGTKSFTSLAGKISSITGGHASAQLDLVGHSALRAGQVGGNSVDTLSGKINHIPDKKVHIAADTSQAQSNIQALINAIGHIHDKNVHINSFTNATVTEHVIPAKGGGGGGGAGAGAGFGRSAGFESRGDGGRFAGLSALFPHAAGIPIQIALQKARSAAQTARGKLRSATGTRNQFAAGFQGFGTSLFGASFGQDATGNEIAPTTSGILAFQQKQADDAAALARNVKTLTRKGLSASLLKQLQGAGQSGIAEINALATASPAEIKRLNALNARTTGSLRSAGMTAGTAIYGRQIALDRRESRESQHLLRQIRDALHSHDSDHLMITDVNGQWVIKAIRKEKRKKGEKSAV